MVNGIGSFSACEFGGNSAWKMDTVTMVHRDDPFSAVEFGDHDPDITKSVAVYSIQSTTYNVNIR